MLEACANATGTETCKTHPATMAANSYGAQQDPRSAAADRTKLSTLCGMASGTMMRERATVGKQSSIGVNGGGCQGGEKKGGLSESRMRRKSLVKQPRGPLGGDGQREQMMLSETKAG